MEDDSISNILFPSLWVILLDKMYLGLSDQVYAIHSER